LFFEPLEPRALLASDWLANAAPLDLGASSSVDHHDGCRPAPATSVADETSAAPATALTPSSAISAEVVTVPSPVNSAEGESPAQKPWQNPHNPLDVDHNGVVIPLDALIIINRVNSVGSQKLAPPVANQSPPPYYDANGDGNLTPLDALVVINFINARSAAAAGEGEPSLGQPVVPT
jgi:hypothetical protein